MRVRSDRPGRRLTGGGAGVARPGARQPVPHLVTGYAPAPLCAAHDLYFAYGGSRRRRVANDGVVTVASQLDPRLQRQARLVAGFDEGHAAVLDDPAVADELRRSLASIAPP